MSVPGVVAVVPMVTREARSRARSPATSIVSASFVCLLLGTTLVSFVLAAAHARGHRPDAGDMAGAVLLVTVVQLAMVLAVGAAIAGGAVTGEREAGRLDLLLAGRFEPLDVVAGKVVAGTTQTVLLVLIGLPVVTAAFLHAGLTLGRLFQVELVTAAAAGAVQAVGVLISAMARRTVVAAVATYAAVAVMVAGPMLPGATRVAAWADPAVVLAPIVTGEPPSWLPGRGGPWPASVLGQLGLTVLCVVLAGRALERRGGS